MLTLSDLFDYTEWADGAVLDAAAAQGADAWTRDLGGSFPTLQSVLGHTLAGEWVWLHRWTGTPPTAFPDWAADASPDQLRSVLDAIAAERRAWLGGLGADEIDTPRPYTLFSGLSSAEPLGVQMQHVVNHSTYHRGQAAAMLRRLGAAPPSTDLVTWVRAGSTRR